MKKRLIFGAAHKAEFIDKWLAENEAAVNELIASGELDRPPTEISSVAVSTQDSKRSPTGEFSRPKRLRPARRAVTTVVDLHA